MKALVTGWRSFIGSHLAEELVRQGWEVDLFKGSIEIPEHINGYGRYDVIYHLAAATPSGSYRYLKEYLKVNLNGTQNVLNWMRKKSEGTVLVFASTGSVYGEPIFSPQTEEHPIRPNSSYAKSKALAEQEIFRYSRKYELKAVILRYYNVVGPRMKKSNVIKIFIHQILRGRPVTVDGDGTQKRCFTHVSDVVDANLLAYNCAEAYGKAFNIAGETTVTLNSLAYFIGRLLSKPVKIRHRPSRTYEILGFEPDISLARTVLGYNPRVNLQEILTQIIEGEKHEV